MNRFCVSVDGVSLEHLAFCGYKLIKEDKDFQLFEDSRGGEYLVKRHPPGRYLYVEDYNDIAAIKKGARSADVIVLP